ncbi:MAG TPA: hypothetical protein VHO72_12230 [Bacteroidales bacterium]|nr:hypothetical protein [Bacteroidales bacterium]
MVSFRLEPVGCNPHRVACDGLWLAFIWHLMAATGGEQLLSSGNQLAPETTV